MSMTVEDADLKRELGKLSLLVRKARQQNEIMRKAAKPVVVAARQISPVGNKTNKRYKNGNVIAEYRPGNLRGALRAFLYKRAPGKAFIGPKVSRRGQGGGIFGPGAGRFDAYYAQMVFGGAKQYRDKITAVALQQSKGKVIGIIRMELQKLFGRFA